VNALAKMGLRDQSQLRETLLPYLEEHMHEYDSHQLSNIINGLAKLGWYPGEDFLQAFTGAAEDHLIDFTGDGGDGGGGSHIGVVVVDQTSI